MKLSMNKTTFLTIVIILGAVLNANAQKIKKGWNFGPLPAVSFNSDLGFQYGVLADIFYYGDGSQFPQYLHKFNVEASWYTKGSDVLHFFYDSKYLIKGIRTTVTTSYLTETMMDFYGFNGYMTPLHLENNNAFYKFDRKLLRAMADFQGPIHGKLGWAAGAAFYQYKIGKVDIEKYRNETTLYDIYINEGIIRTEEKNGGQHVEFKLGLVYDTRDNEPDPTRGIWTEAIFYGSPDIISKHGNNYINLSIAHRGYVPVWKEKITFAYRLNYQGSLHGQMPFYMQQNLSTLFMRQTTSEGLGGLNSLRGILRNRVVGNGYIMGNIEFRYRIFNFRLFAQNWYFAVNPFFDAGMIVQPYRKEQIMASDNAMVYNGDKESLHMSAGLGVKAVMNQNFILSVEWGKTLDKRDGDSGMNIGLNYLY